MIATGYVVVDGRGQPVRGLTQAITVYPSVGDADAVAEGWGRDRWTETLRPLGVAAAHVLTGADCEVYDGRRIAV